MKAPEETLWPTMVKKRVGNVFIGVDNSVWAYYIVPMSPVADAKTEEEKMDAGEPIRLAFQNIADVTPIRGKSRGISRSAYREFHMEIVEFPVLFQPQHNAMERDLRDWFGEQVIYRRVLTYGIRLKPMDIAMSLFKKGGFARVADSVAQTFSEGGTPLSDYDQDYEEVAKVLSRSGLRPLTKRDQKDIESYWNSGNHADVPYIAHADHIHFFESAYALDVAERIGRQNCNAWSSNLAGHRAISYVSVSDFDMGYRKSTENIVQWASQLIDRQAAVISIRGSIERSEITAHQLSYQKAEYLKDLNTARSAGKLDQAQHMKKISELDAIEAAYKTDGGQTTVVDASIIVGFNGILTDIRDSEPPLVSLSAMEHRQMSAWAETMISSGFRANPDLHDLPISMLAYSGLPSMNIVGDKNGALVGFTEKDAQPAYLSPVAASKEDSSPITLVAAGTGTGKSVLMLYMAHQFAVLGAPVVIIDPKMGSDHSDAVRLSGGQVARLDDMLESDGVFDAIRFSKKKDVGVSIAAAALIAVNPWGADVKEYEVDVLNALFYGVSKGAVCSGQAMEYAYRDNQISADPAVADKIYNGLMKARRSPMFSAIYGLDPKTEPLSINNGITLIMVGDGRIPLPENVSLGADVPFEERVGLAIVRMMVYGSSMALTGRGGVIMLDEAHVFLNSNPQEVKLLGRVARSQEVLPMLFTQETTDALQAGLRPYISRGFIGPVKSEEQAVAAFKLFGLEPTPERVSRLLRKPNLTGSDEPDYSSMRALYRRDPETGVRTNVRGTIFLYSDLQENTLPIEVKLPERFLFLASTNPDDIRARKEELRVLEAELV